jgi:two-component system sensor histidine kinase ChvG
MIANVSLARLARRRLRAISPLTTRILAVNLLALAIPIVGILFLARYQERLIDNELAGLRTEAKLFAVAISEGCVSSDEENAAIEPQPARQMIRHLVETTTTRTQLFNDDGELIADSHLLMGPGGLVQLEELPPLHPNQSLSEAAVDELGFIIDSIPGRRQIAPLPRRGIRDEKVLDAVRTALGGTIATQVWTNNHGKLIFIAAAPVQNIESVLGAVLVVRDGTEIDNAIRSVRLDMLRVSAVGLAITIFLSIYLAGKISRPIRKLAGAAIRQTRDAGLGRRIDIPDFAARHDEIGDLSVALGDMTQALWNRMDAIERFAADVSHELKNPLTSLRSAVETVNRVEDPAQKARLMAIITDDVSRMDRLISDISNASRLDAELSRVEPEPADICEILQVAADLNATEDRLVKISLSCAREKQLVMGLEGRLMQVFQNLIENAISFSPPGGTVTIAVQPQDEQVAITIEDEGPGIPERKITEIFERFYTERPAGEAFGKHSGLGLSISKQIVEAHRGMIFAENRRDDEGMVIGSRFTVILPRWLKKTAAGRATN